MLTTRNRTEITAAIFLGAILVTGNPSSTHAQPDRRERELQEQQELRELEIQQARLEAELAEIDAAQRRLRERRGHPVDEPEHGPPPDQCENTRARLEDELHELRVRESELRAAVEHMELAGRHDEAREAQRELVKIRHEMEMHELAINHFERQRREAEPRELAMMIDRLDYVDKWHHIAFDPRRAVMMATQAIVEIHMASEQSDRAVEMLEGLLESVKERGSRTAIRFALRDVYMQSGNLERAAQHMVQIILENSAGAH